MIDFPSIPEKKYFSISEASSLCGLRPHTLRFWEKEFSQLKPTIRKGRRRLYQKEDILLVRKIRKLLREEGLTIQGAKRKLSLLKVQEDFSSKDEVIEELEELLKEIKKVI
ncbi:MAG: MerR family transcriptional regulator [Pseudomonadota bacterium]|nr:MerR family transcriptional regulator [Pseudomonadota bacterium]